MLYTSLTERLKNQHTSIGEMTAGLDADRLTLSLEPGKWNIHDNIAHLTVYQPLFINRIQTILITDNPSFGSYRADDDETFLAWRGWTVGELLNKMDADRQQLYQLIINISVWELSKVGTHLKYGRMTITQWTEFFLLHEAHHLFTIFRLAQSV